MGRLAPEKSPALFLAVAKELVALAPSVRFLVVGDGPLRPWLEAAVARLGLTRWGSRRRLFERRNDSSALGIQERPLVVVMGSGGGSRRVFHIGSGRASFVFSCGSGVRSSRVPGPAPWW